MEKNFYPFNHEDVVLVKGNKAVLSCRGQHLCGYVVFPNKKIPIEIIENITNEATLKTGYGFGAMIDMLAGGRSF